MRNSLFSAFIPWIFFSVFYGSTPDAMGFASITALILMILLNFDELRKGFVLPWGSIIIFIFFALNDQWFFIPWAADHLRMLMNVSLAALIWLSMLILKPFSMQYARREVDSRYWHSRGFVKTNWMITLVWGLLLMLAALPSILLPQDQLLDAWFWNYGLTILCIAVALVLTKNIPSLYIGRIFWSKVKHLPPLETPYLQNNFAPVKDEVDLDELKIEGNLPVTLKGMYVRNGPNPLFSPYTYTYPIDGDGMIHCVTLAHGWAAYKNRFVHTKGLVAEKKAGKALYGGIKLPLLPDPKYVKDLPTKNTASVHVALFGKHLLALYESMPAYILDKDLKTHGEWKPQGHAPFNINAHHRHDPKTGQIYACTYDVDHAPYLTLYEFDANGILQRTAPIAKNTPTMIHDFVITEHYIVVFDAPAVFDVKSKDILSYHENQPMTILLIERATFEVKKIETESFFVYHFVNAYEQDHKIIVDFVHHETLILDPLLHQGGRGPRLYRAEIDIYHLTYQHYCLCEASLEFPTYALPYTGQPYRYGYFAAKSSEKLDHFDTVLKYDFIERSHQHFKLGHGVEIGEAIFVPEIDSTAEDHGYLMLFVYHEEAGTSDFVLLDAQKPKAEKPMAIIKLGRRVPNGLHGSWIETP